MTASTEQRTLLISHWGNYIKRLVGSGVDPGGTRVSSSESTKLGTLWDGCMTKRLSTALISPADAIGCTIEEVKRFSRRLASLIIHHDHSCRKQIELNFEKAEHRKRLEISDNNSEDEPPMALSVVQQLKPPPEFARAVAPDGMVLLHFNLWICPSGQRGNQSRRQSRNLSRAKTVIPVYRAVSILLISKATADHKSAGYR